MGKAALVERDTEQGRRLIEALDQAGFPVVAAFWSFFPEENLYRLIIASPVVDEKGPREAYTKIQAMLQALPMPDFTLDTITVLSPYHPLVIDVRLSQATEGAPYLAHAHLVHAPVHVISRSEKRDGQTYGDIEKWTILAGRLMNVETVATDVELEGMTDEKLGRIG
jgi:hypothetical protein